MTLELTKTTIFFGVALFVLGYFVGNTIPVQGTGATIQIQGNQELQAPPAVGDAAQQQAPSSVKLEIEDDPIVGNREAKVYFYEFSDYQCPFCRRFFSASLPQIEENYIKTGKILFVYKDFPLTQIHPGALPAAIYSECANRQGKWKEFHDTIFNEQNKQGGGTVQFGQTELDQWAAVAGLDMVKLESCAQEQTVAAEVQDDMNKGVALGVSGTPSFFIGSPERGFVNVVGAQPYEVLKQAIDQQLA